MTGVQTCALPIYKKSIGEAMREAATQVLESIAAQAIGHAIYSLALGFERTAERDYPSASAAFTAAAIWGSVGATAAVAGRMIAPPAAGAAGSAGNTVAGAPASDSTGAGGSAQANQVPALQIIVQGHIYGNADAVIEAINEAVLERRVTLTATNTTTDQVVTR